jgi:glycosyltransferase 2 family protein
VRDLSSELVASTEPVAARPSWQRPLLRILSVGISAALLVVLYRSIDVRMVGQSLRRADVTWLIVSLSMIVPITVLRAIRFYWVAPLGALTGLVEALRLTLVASALNVFVPGKAGDLIKSYFVRRRGGGSTGVAVSIVVYERLCDLFGLIFWCMAGWVIARPDTGRVPAAIWPLLGGIGLVAVILVSSEHAAELTRAVIGRILPHHKLRKLRNLAEGWPDLVQRLHGRRKWVILFSVFLWLVHVIQMWMFTLALSLSIPFTVCASLSAIALMAGQLPFTLGGLGARDMALVVLLAGYMRPESAAAMGILISTRGLLPPLAALPIMRPYLSAAMEEARRIANERER